MSYNKFISLLFFFCITSLAIASTSASNTQKHVLDIQHWRTPNGAQVYFIPIHDLPMVDVNVAFDAGSSRDNTQFGLANFTNQMLDEGSLQYTAEKIAESFDNFGAIYSNSVDQDMAIVGLRSLTDPKYLNPVVDTFASVLNQPAFNSADFSRVQKLILSQIDDEQQTPSTIADNTFYNVVYGNYPYGHSVLGAKEIIGKLDTKDLQKFYRDFYCGENVVMAIVGDVSRDQAEQLANKIIGKLPQGQPAAKLVKPTYDPNKLEKHITYPASQTYIRIGEIAVKRDDPRYFPLMVGNNALGGGALTSRLFEEVREKRGLSYNVRSSVIPMKSSGVFLITLQTRNETANESIELSKKVLSEFISKGITDKELDAAKNNIIGSFFSALDSNNAIASNLLYMAFYQLPLDYFDTFRDKIAAVNKAQIISAFSDVLNPKRMVTVTVGPQEKTPKTAAVGNNDNQLAQNAAVPVRF